jgi:AcrR family transcriptional regulator
MPPFQRARSAEHKEQRSAAFLDAARVLVQEQGAAALTLTGLAARVGVHHSALRRYFSSHKDVLLQLAAEGWARWADRLEATLQGRTLAAAELGEAVARSLLADPLLCDLLANVPLHLEREVTVDRVVAFKEATRGSVARLAAAVEAAAPALGSEAALDVITAANALGATLWQVGHPAAGLQAALAADPTLMLVSPEEFEPTFVRLLSATCAGLGGGAGE